MPLPGPIELPGGTLRCFCAIPPIGAVSGKLTDPRSFSRPYFTVQRGECVETDLCDEGGGWGKKEAGLGAALVFLFNFQRPLPDKSDPCKKA